MKKEGKKEASETGDMSKRPPAALSPCLSGREKKKNNKKWIKASSLFPNSRLAKDVL